MVGTTRSNGSDADRVSTAHPRHHRTVRVVMAPWSCFVLPPSRRPGRRDQRDDVQ